MSPAIMVVTAREPLADAQLPAQLLSCPTRRHDSHMVGAQAALQARLQQSS